MVSQKFWKVVSVCFFYAAKHPKLVQQNRGLHVASIQNGELPHPACKYFLFIYLLNLLKLFKYKKKIVCISVGRCGQCILSVVLNLNRGYGVWKTLTMVTKLKLVDSWKFHTHNRKKYISPLKTTIFWRFISFVKPAERLGDIDTVRIWTWRWRIEDTLQWLTICFSVFHSTQKKCTTPRSTDIKSQNIIIRMFLTQIYRQVSFGSSADFVSC